MFLGVDFYPSLESYVSDKDGGVVLRRIVYEINRIKAAGFRFWVVMDERLNLYN